MSRYLIVVVMIMTVILSIFGRADSILISDDQLPKMKSELEQLLAKKAWNEAYGVSVKLSKLLEADQQIEPLVKAECYDLVSQAHHRTFRLREATRFSEKAISLRRLERQKDRLRIPTDSFAQSLYDLGLRYVLLEESSKAAEAFAESLALLNQDKKGASPLLVDLHLELSRVHLSQGDVETARNRLNAAQDVLNKLTPPDPQRSADVRLQLAVHHLSLHDLRQAGEYLKSAGVYYFAKKEKTLGEMCERFNVLLLQNTLLCMKGQFESASKSIERVLSVLVPLKAKWNDYPSFVELEAMYRFQLAVAKLGCQDANGAEEEFRKVVQLEESQTVSWSHVCALARVHIAQIVGQKKGRSKEAMELLEKALTVQHSLLQEGYNFQSDVQRLQFTIKMRSALDAYLSLAVKDQAEAKKMYAQVLRWKTAVYSRNNRDRRQSNTVSSKTYGETQRELLDAAASVRTWEAATPTVGSSPQVDQQWIDRGVELRDQRLALERKMAALLKDAKGQNSESLSVSPEQLAMLCPVGAPFIEYCCYDHTLESQGGAWAVETRVLAFVVRQGHPVVCVQLGRAADIESAINAWYGHLLDKNGMPQWNESGTAPLPSLRTQAQAIAHLIWKPIESFVKNSSKVVIAPDGLLWRLPFGALPGNRDHHFLIQDYQLSYVFSGQHLSVIARGSSETKKPSLLLINEIDYGDKQKTGQLGDVGDLAWTQRMSATFATNYAGLKPVILTKSEPTTDAVFSQLENGYREVVLFGHGPTLSSSKAQSWHGTLGQTVSGTPTEQRFALLLQPRVPLAYANIDLARGGGHNTPAVADWSLLNMNGTRSFWYWGCLVQQGPTVSGEGVIGISRALHLAGCQTTLASLWHVNGKETERFAIYLHKQVWQSPDTSPPTALQNTQLFSVEKRGNEAAHPYYWAGWYVIGDIPTAKKK